MMANVLLVEDNALDLALTMRALRESAVVNHVTVIKDGDRALEYIYTQSAWSEQQADSLPALIILEAHSPRTNGFELLRRVRANARTRDIPILVLTSARDEQVLATSLMLGANRVMRKPDDCLEYVSTIRNAVRAWGEHLHPSYAEGAQ